MKRFYEIFLVFIASFTLIACWYQNQAYIEGGIMNPIAFLKDLWITPASRSTTIDIIALGLVLQVWMIRKGLKLNLSKKSIVFVSFLHWFVAMAVGFPLFLLLLERHRMNQKES